MKIFGRFRPGQRKEENDKMKRIFDLFRPVRLPEQVKNRKGRILLHIGDVPAWGYPYIKRLIKKVKPEILVHTGDMVDNLKVGRLEEDVPAYKRAVPRLIRFMEKWAEKVYIVPGNNDLMEFIQDVSEKSIIVPANTVVDIEGVSCLLCHWVAKIDGEAEFYLYGHGPTGDTHSFYKPEEGKVFCNTFFAPTVIFMEDKSYVELINYNGERHQ